MLASPGPARPLRRFGQNFLCDRVLAGRLVELFDPRPGQTVVEIGPGTGALTRILAPRCGRFVALELDERLVPGIAELLAGREGAEVRRADALAVDWDALADELGASRLRVIGNLPYNVATPIVRRLLASDCVGDLQVVLQREVADRFLAAPGRKDYGPISVIAALRACGRRLVTLGPSAFRPRPKVTSTAIALARRDDPPLPADEIPALERCLFRGFGHRRKMLANNFGADGERVRAFLAAHGLSPDARAEAVPAAVWLALSRHL
jgi:16S rRNA (adenine1518-N6/adenine1519-N6)-dimethyltransferase